MGDFKDYMVSREPVPVTINVNGYAMELMVRGLPWSRKNQIVSLSIHYDDDGKTQFNGDYYYRECLKYMVVTAPWGETNDIFLLQIDSELGSQLEELIPKAFGGGKESLASVDDIKKEP